ncbi:MAG: hypothetical protein P4L41_19045 [Flavipsychrobacter sp.]|nr:hypothetical protein [Flavipsychrobacter sp.]
MKAIAVFIFSLFLLSACKKSNNNPYSIWYVNGQKYSSNDVYVDVGKGETDFATNSFKTGFGFTFDPVYYGDMPLKLDCTPQSAPHVCFGVYYNDTGYSAKTDIARYINKVTVKKGLTQYTLDSTWLFNVYNFQDSVFKDSILVYGVFNEPYSD